MHLLRNLIQLLRIWFVSTFIVIVYLHKFKIMKTQLLCWSFWILESIYDFESGDLHTHIYSVLHMIYIYIETLSLKSLEFQKINVVEI